MPLNEIILTIVANGILTPILVLITTWLKEQSSKGMRQERRDDTYMKALAKRVETLELEIKAVRVELKNRDVEYLALYKEHATLRAKYEVLEAEYEKLKKDYEGTVAELSSLKDDIKSNATAAAENIQKL